MRDGREDVDGKWIWDGFFCTASSNAGADADAPADALPADSEAAAGALLAGSDAGDRTSDRYVLLGSWKSLACTQFIAVSLVFPDRSPINM